MMEIVRSPEELKQIRIAELEQSISQIANLLDNNKVSGGARDQLEPSLAAYREELAALTKDSEDRELLVA